MEDSGPDDTDAEDSGPDDTDAEDSGQDVKVEASESEVEDHAGFHRKSVHFSFICLTAL